MYSPYTKETEKTSKIVDNHHLIDPAAMVYDRNVPEYQPLRRFLVRDLCACQRVYCWRIPTYV